MVTNGGAVVIVAWSRCPRLGVVTLAPGVVALRSAPAKSKIQTRPIRVRMRLVRRRGQRAFDGLERTDHFFEQPGQCRHGPEISAVSPQRRPAECAKARRRCDDRANARPGQRRARPHQPGALVIDDGKGGGGRAGVCFIEHDQRLVSAGQSCGPTRLGRRGGAQPGWLLGAEFSGQASRPASNGSEAKARRLLSGGVGGCGSGLR